MRPLVLALVVLGAVVVTPMFATMGAQAYCPNPVIGYHWCPPGSTGVVYPRVCFAHATFVCDLIP